MARARALRKEDLRELGWKALVSKLGVANAARFVMELHEGKQDYSKLRGKLFADKNMGVARVCGGSGRRAGRPALRR
jgi:hypothetical protein